jgi:hypothetical protein
VRVSRALDLLAAQLVNAVRAAAPAKRMGPARDRY